MDTIIGQKKLVSLFSDYTVDSMPRTLMLLGEQGSGKKLLATKLAKRLGLELVELNTQTTAEELLDFCHCPVTKIYWLDLTEVPEKAQNKFLKFIEEPPATVRVILGAESEVGILSTILNRCLKLTLEPYTEDELKSFSWAPKNADPLLYKFCNTPGKLNTVGDASQFTQILAHSKHIVKTLPELNHFAYGEHIALSLPIAVDDKTKTRFDMHLFMDLLAYTAFEDFKATFAMSSFEIYKATIEAKQQILNKAVNKKAFVLNFFNKLWKVTHDTQRA
jgi:hypothetical protein